MKSSTKPRPDPNAASVLVNHLILADECESNESAPPKDPAKVAATMMLAEGLSRNGNAVEMARRHAVVIALLTPRKLRAVSIRQTASRGGGVLLDPPNAALMTKAEIDVSMVQLLAGRAAEEVLLGAVLTCWCRKSGAVASSPPAQTVK